MPAELKQIAEGTGAVLIASTGFHLQRFYPTQHWIHTIAQTRLEELFVHELTHSVQLEKKKVCWPKYMLHLCILKYKILFCIGIVHILTLLFLEVHFFPPTHIIRHFGYGMFSG